MSITLIANPDVAALAISGATVQLLEAVSFSDDGSHLVVKATFTEDGGQGQLRYGYFLYDIENEAYALNFNTLLVSDNRLTSSNIEKFSFTGTIDNYSVVAEIEEAGEPAATLTHLVNGVVQSADVLTDALGVDYDINVEHFLLAEDARHLAVQTSDASLASDLNPDTNDSSDIYVIDLETNVITRVSEVGGAEVASDTFLQSIAIVDDVVQVGFVTDEAYVSFSKYDQNTTDTSGPIGTRTDAYMWSDGLTTQGALTGKARFTLLSELNNNTASGFVSRDAGIALTGSGQYFSSTSEFIDSNDQNEALDTFVYQNGEVSILNYNDVVLDNTTQLLDSSTNGRYVVLLSLASQVSGTTGSQQLIMIDTQSGEGRVVSQNAAGNAGDNYSIGGVIAPSGVAVAFTSLATNLTNELPNAFGGSLYLRQFDDINSSPEGEIQLATLPLSGEELQLDFSGLIDQDGVGDISVEWYRDGEIVEGTEDNTLILNDSDNGKLLSATVKYTDDAGNDESIAVNEFTLFDRPVRDDESLDFTAKYIVFESEGENLFDFDLGFADLNYDGQSTLFSGSGAVEAIKIAAGQIIDITNLKSSSDKLYLPGNVSEYLTHSSIDVSSGIMTLISTHDFTYTEVKFIATNTAADVLIFADGKLTASQLKTYLQASSPSLDELVIDPSENYSSTNNAINPAKVKAIALDAGGEVFTSFTPDTQLQVSGGTGVDKVYIQAGTTVDATNLKSSVDHIYMQGTWSEYDKNFDSSGNLVLTRSVTMNDAEYIESVSVASGSTVATNDLLVFADGSIRTKQAVDAIRDNNNDDFSALAGFDSSVTTPTDNLADLDLIFPSQTAGKSGMLDSLFVVGDEPVYTSDISDVISEPMSDGSGVLVVEMDVEGEVLMY